MTAKEFIKKNLVAGQLVEVTIGEKTVKAYFGGYKTFDGICPDLEFALYPTFYAVGKDGKMVKKRPKGLSFTTYGLSRITDVKPLVFRYRHVGFWHDPKDIEALSHRPPETILQKYLEGFGHFKKVEHDEDTYLISPDDKSFPVGNYEYMVCYNSALNYDYIDIFKRIDA